MQENRTFDIELGDGYGDSHGKSSRHTVTVHAADVSDAALSEGYRRTVEFTGFDLLNDFDEHSASLVLLPEVEEKVRAVLADGRAKRWDSAQFSRVRMSFSSSPLGEPAFDPLDLILGYVGSTLPDFRWRLDRYPSLLAILPSTTGTFGQGLYE